MDELCTVGLVLDVGQVRLSSSDYITWKVVLDLLVCKCGDVETLRSRSEEIAEMLERRSVDNCCVQDTKFRGKPVRMICGEAAFIYLFIYLFILYFMLTFTIKSIKHGDLYNSLYTNSYTNGIQ